MVGGLINGILIASGYTFTADTIVGYVGQSLALGSAGGLTPGTSGLAAPSGSHMFDTGGTRPKENDTRVTVPTSQNMYVDTLYDAQQLEEAVDPGDDYGETPLTGCAAQSTDIDALYFSAGEASQSIANISVERTIFTDAKLMVEYARKLIEAAGRSATLDSIIFHQGTADIVAPTNQATYLASLNAYFESVKTHFSSAMGSRNLTIPLIVSQCSNPNQNDIVGNFGPILAQLEFGLLTGAKYCSGPRYWLPHRDFAHLTDAGYALMGEMDGKVRKEIAAGTDWKPLHWTNVSRSTTTITVTYDVPVGNLQFDTTMVSDPGDYGFAYSGANITDVSITGAAEVTITIDADAGGTLTYAHNDPTNDPGPTTGARGNLCDSDTVVSQLDGRELTNWACHQSEAVA